MWEAVFYCVVSAVPTVPATPPAFLECGRLETPYSTLEQCAAAAREAISLGGYFVPSRTTFTCNKIEPK